MLLAETSALTLVPWRTAIWDRVSPERTVTVPELDVGVLLLRVGAGAGAASPSPGMTSVVPGRIHRPPWLRPLARTTASGLTPCRAAIP